MKIYYTVVTIALGAAAQRDVEEEKTGVLPTVQVDSTMPTFSALQSLFPEHLQPQMPQILQDMRMPKDPFAGLADMLEEMMNQAPEQMQNMFSGILPMMAEDAPMFVDPSQGPTVTVIRVINRPDWVDHVCFGDSVHYCKEHLDSNEHKTRMCMMDHFQDLNPKCKEFLSEEPTLVEACYGNIQQYCHNDRYSCEKVMNCMITHESDINDAKCLPFVLKMAQNMLGIEFLADELPAVGELPVAMGELSADELSADELSADELSADESLSAPEVLPAVTPVAKNKPLRTDAHASAFVSSKLNTDFGAESKGRFEMDNSMYMAGMAGGMLAFAVVGAVIFLQRRREKENHQYQSILSPEEREYDEYA